MASSHGAGHAGNAILGQSKEAGTPPMAIRSINDLATTLAHMRLQRHLIAGELAGIIYKRHQKRPNAKVFRPTGSGSGVI